VRSAGKRTFDPWAASGQPRNSHHAAAALVATPTTAFAATTINVPAGDPTIRESLDAAIADDTVRVAH